ncbi:MAG: hypothetical protein K1X94_11145 [Sandaracinaceae bacterium]|nr:hypothetical protein [Sandaracinaceae bacterium]
MRRSWTFLIPALVSCALWTNGGCTCESVVSTTPRDAGRAGPPSDECGNGLDDDGNGRIDDGCPCGPGEVQSCFSGMISASSVGACSSGTQTCDVRAGVEWGDWGDYGCMGEVGPVAERCDGSDADCDGAVDESCPCDPEATRDCRVELTAGPCEAGTQVCRNGTWSTCEGAIAPVAEVCNDGIDNDCDGEVDDRHLCDCMGAEAERCRDGIDNDCDGEIDEMECTPDWPPDATIDAGGTDSGPHDGGPPTDAGPICPGGAIADFRDSIAWVHSLPAVGHMLPDMGTASASAWLGGVDGDAVTLDLRSNYDTPSYSFAGTTTSDNGFGRLSFVDGAELTWASRAAVGPTDVTGVHLVEATTFVGTLDLGLGPWTSDPTLYTSSPMPVSAPDMLWGRGNEATSRFEAGTHYALSGVPADPSAGSFLPNREIFFAATDATGNVYFGGRFEGILDVGSGVTIASTTARPIVPGWARFAVALQPDGRARWARAWSGEQEGYGAVDPTGTYLLTSGYTSSAPQRAILELLDGSTGVTLFRHVASAQSFATVAHATDGDGNVYVSGTTLDAPMTLGPLFVPANRAFVASFDRGGALRWMQLLLDSSFPGISTGRFLVSEANGEVALIVGYTAITASSVDLQVEGCEVALERRWYPRLPSTESGHPTSTRPSNYRDVTELIALVFDANNGGLRWARRIDSLTSGVSMQLHPSGDLLLVMHNAFDTTHVDYGVGPVADATHVFRLVR